MPAKFKSSQPKAFKITIGAVSLPIYPLADGRWCIAYRAAKKGKCQRITRVSLQEAKETAENLCRDIAAGRHLAATITEEDRLQLLAAREFLQPLGLSVDVAARELAEAHKLTHGAAVLEMARFWVRHHQAVGSRRTAADALAEMLRAKKSQGLDAHYLHNVREPLAKFAAKVPGPIGEIGATEIRRYLEDLTVEPRTRNNIRGSLVMLFRFARDAGDLADGRTTEAEKVGKVKVRRKAPHVYTAHQLRDWLEAVRAEWLPWMALGAFAGIRTAEIERMDWSDIQWISKEIYVRPEVSKTAEGRYAPLLDNPALWLAPHRQAAVLSFCPKVG